MVDGNQIDVRNTSVSLYGKNIGGRNASRGDLGQFETEIDDIVESKDNNSQGGHLRYQAG